MTGTAATAGSRSLVSREGQPRVRRAGDVTSVLVGALLLLWAVVNVDRTDALNRALAALVQVLPTWALEPLSIVYSFAFI
ncbi:MAG: hypothetical protein ACNA8R_10680 [Nitriliruptoraceae bacterium]